MASNRSQKAKAVLLQRQKAFDVGKKDDSAKRPGSHSGRK